MNEIDEVWMAKALEAAAEAQQLGEVPVGAVIIDAEGSLLSIASNRTITDSDPTAHAEILALRSAALSVQNYRLVGATIYTTVEPCVMCAGALVNARVKRLVFGTTDKRFGAVESLFRLCDNAALNHRIDITSGILADDCRLIIQNFFRPRR